MKKAALWVLTLTLFSSSIMMAADSTVRAEEAKSTSSANPVSQDDLNLLKTLGVNDAQFTILGNRASVVAYAARTRKLSQTELQKFLNTYLYAFPQSGPNGGSIIDGLVEFEDGRLEGVTPPHGPYYRKPIYYYINGTIVKSTLQPGYGETPLLDAAKVLNEIGYETSTDTESGMFEGNGSAGSFTMVLGGTKMTFNGRNITLEQATALDADGTALVPMQAFVELGLRVEWDGYTHDFHIASLPPLNAKSRNYTDAARVDVYVNRDLNVTVNGGRLYLGGMPLNYQGTNYLPSDALAAALDLDISLNDSNEPIVYVWTKREPFGWRPNKQAVGAPLEEPAYPGPGQAQLIDGVTLRTLLPPRSSWTPGKGDPLEGQALRYNGILYLPVTEIAEKIGYETSYDSDTKTLRLVKPIELFAKEKLRLGVDRNSIRNMIGNPSRVLLNGRTGNGVWRYDEVAESGYVPAEEKVGDVVFDKPDVDGLKSGKLDYQLFIQCYKPDRIMTSFTLYYRDANGDVQRYDVNEYGGWSLEQVQ